MKHWWHSWRARVWCQRLEEITARVLALEACEKLHGQNVLIARRSYAAVCDRITASSALEYHCARAAESTPYYA